jgi:hypothetical protein
MAKYITIEDLVRREGSISQAHQWLNREGVPCSYLSVRSWYRREAKPDPAHAALLLSVGVAA